MPRCSRWWTRLDSAGGVHGLQRCGGRRYRRQLPLTGLLALLLVSAIILAIVLVFTTFIARKLGFNKEDEIHRRVLRSKKSLISGVPMAKVIFPSAEAGLIVLPLMIFHQLQLMVCAVLAQRYARRPETTELLDEKKGRVDCEGRCLISALMQQRLSQSLRRCCADCRPIRRPR